MAQDIHERANSPKVREQIRQDAYQATKKAVETVKQNLTGRGFKSEEITPIIKEGAFDAISE